MTFNTRQANIIAEGRDICKDAKDLYGRMYNYKESFAEEFATSQDNALDELEGNTTVDGDSASGQAVLNVASTTGFRAGDNIIIHKGGSREETGIIDTVGSGTLTLTTNLIYTHNAVDADEVRTMGALYDLGLSYTTIVTAVNQFMTNYVNFWTGDAVSTREYGKDARAFASNQMS